MTDTLQTWPRHIYERELMAVQPVLISLDREIATYRGYYDQYRGIAGTADLNRHCVSAELCLIDFMSFFNESADNNRPIHVVRTAFNMGVGHCNKHLKACSNILANILEIHEHE